MSVPGLIFLFSLFLISLVIVFIKSPEKAFIYVFFPVVFLGPTEVNVRILDGLLTISSNLVVLLPIIPFFIQKRLKYYTFSALDVLMLCYLFFIFISEYSNAKFSTAGVACFDKFWRAFIPYLFAKVLIEPLDMSVKLAKCLVVLAIIISFAMIQEFLTGKSIFVQLYWRLFPDQFFSKTISRFGVYRVAGPFSHAISAATVMGILFCINLWLSKFHRPKMRFRNFCRSLLIGSSATLLTFSRGPMIATGFGLYVYNLYKTRRLISLVFSTIIFLSILAFTLNWLYQYSTDAYEVTDLSGTALYRGKLYELYGGYIWEKPFFGWGSQYPKVLGYESIDNGVIFIALKEGIVTLLLLIFVLLFVFIRLLLTARRIKNALDRRSLCFLFAAIIIIFSISFLSASLVHDNVIASFIFAMLGWSEGFILNQKKSVQRAFT